MQHHFLVGVLVHAHVHDHLAALRELDRIADQVDQDLAHPSGVADYRHRHLRRDVARQFQPLLLAAQGQRLDRVADLVVQLERNRLQLQLPRLDLGEVEDVVDDSQERFGRQLGHVQVVALLARQLRVQGQFGHADDAVHGRADFMAHVRPELALGPVGRLRSLLRLLQRDLGLLADGDVTRHAEGADDLTLLVAQRHLGRRGPGFAAVGPRLLFHHVHERFGGADDALFVVESLLGVLGQEVIEVGLAGGLLRVLDAVPLGQGVVDADEAALEVLEVDAVGPRPVCAR